MNKDSMDLLKILKSAGRFEIFLIIFLSLPFVLNQWLEIVNGFDLNDNANPDRIRLIVCFYVTSAYIVCIGLLLWGTSQSKKLKINADVISNILAGRNTPIGSAEYIRKKSGLDINEDYIEELIREFPNRFRKVFIKGGKVGIGSIDYEEEEKD